MLPTQDVAPPTLKILYGLTEVLFIRHLEQKKGNGKGGGKNKSEREKEDELRIKEMPSLII